jgi:hypothetical protein
MLRPSKGFRVDTAFSIQIAQPPLISKIGTPNTFNSQDPWLNKGVVIGVWLMGKAALCHGQNEAVLEDVSAIEVIETK